jgi:hypothetical protein
LFDAGALLSVCRNGLRRSAPAQRNLNVGIELAGASPPKFAAENYPDYPLIILSDGGKKKIARVTADEKGNYRIAQPPGDYILDVQGRGRKHVRAKPQPFTVVSNQTVHVDMDIDTGIR